MQTYWDLEEKDRAQLSEADVEKYCAAELMAAGVLRAEPPEYDDEPPNELPEPTMFYRVRRKRDGKELDVVFRTPEEAQDFLRVSPLIVSHKYLSGSYRQGVDYVEAADDFEVSTCSAISESVLNAHLQTLERRAAVREANEKKREKYETAIRAQNKALEGLWSDWHGCRELDVKMQKIGSTFREYVEIAGDPDTAAAFLRKAFEDRDIMEAGKWCGLDIPMSGPPLKEMPAPDAEQAAEAFS